jgi:ribonuclease HI
VLFQFGNSLLHLLTGFKKLMAKKKKYYVVWLGANPGVYDTWDQCQLQINGFPGAAYKSFESRHEAEAAYRSGYAALSYASSPKSSTPKSAAKPSRSQIILDSISVDAACSGNPGVMEYQGVDTRSGERIFYQKFNLGTNNIGEFLAIVHALAMLEKQGKDTPVYTDSRNALLWVKNKQCKTTLPRKSSTEPLFQMIERAERWLKTHHWKNPLLKWETAAWGEIPADFGRK